MQWMTTMSSRLEKRIQNSEYRLDFLRTVHYEATRAGLDPQLVLALIDVVSGFDKYAVSSTGAQGYMGVRPEWIGIIGRPSDNLFHQRTNMRYGCTIVRHYLEIEQGELYRTLARYELAIERGPGNDIVEFSARFPNLVRSSWHDRWSYKNGGP